MKVSFGGRTKRGLGVVPSASFAVLMALRGGSVTTGRAEARENGKRRPLGVLVGLDVVDSCAS